MVQLPDGFVERLLKEADEARVRRAETMPTTEDAVRVLMDAWLRLKELGWSEATYAPRDGSRFQSIEVGSTGLHDTHVMMASYEHPTFWIDGEWPARPVLWRPFPESQSVPSGATQDSAVRKNAGRGAA